jgi:hypothetical protein
MGWPDRPRWKSRTAEPSRLASLHRDEFERKRQASRRQPFLGGPAVLAALKYYCRAKSDKSREPKVQASHRQRILGGRSTRTPSLPKSRTTAQVAVPVRSVTCVRLREGVLVDVVAAGTVGAGESLKRLDRVEDIADVWAFGDAVNTGQGSWPSRSKRTKINAKGDLSRNPAVGQRPGTLTPRR